ncbi:MAG: hypothetical protein QM773_16850 [Hyphomonadaceae bacterium]
MLRSLRAFCTGLLIVAFSAPALAQAPSLVSATPQQKDAWGEDIVRYCAAEIQASVSADPFGRESHDIADVLTSVMTDEWNRPKTFSSLEVKILNAASMRKAFEDARKDPKQAKSLPSLKGQVVQYDAYACIASRAMYLLGGARETVTVWNKSPDTVDVVLNNAFNICTVKPGESCNLPVPTGAPANIIGVVGNAARYGPYGFDPVGDSARTFVLTKPGQ